MTQCVWQQELSLDSIASQRSVQLSTVQSYIAEAMTAGYPYPWHRLGVPHALLASLCSHLNAFHQYQLEVVQLQQQSEGQQQQQGTGQGYQLQVQQGQSVTQHQLGAQSCPQKQAEAALCLHPEESPWRQQQQPDPVLCMQHAGVLMQQRSIASANLPPPPRQRHMPQHWSALPAQCVAKQADLSGRDRGGGVFDVGVAQQQSLTPANSEQSCAPQLWLQPDGTVTPRLQAMGCSDNVGCVGQQGVQLVNVALIEELVKTGKDTKALREWMGSDAMSYGQMRVALAHLYRLTLLHIRLL